MFTAIILAALSLSGFGIDANPGAPSGDEIVAHAPKRVDFMVYVDVAAMVPKNYAATKALANSSELARVPDLQREIKAAIAQLEMGINMVKGAVGIDPVNDIKSVAAWVAYPSKGDPRILVHVRGRFPAGFVSTVATTSGLSPIKVAGRDAILEDGMMLTTAKDGSLLFGTPTLVRPQAMRGPKRGGRSALARQAARVIDSKPFFALVSTPSKAALKRIGRELGGNADNALKDLLNGHSFASFAMHHNGVSWSYTGRNRGSLERAEMASRGILQLMRASHFAARGIANIFFAAVDSYRGKDDKIDAIIAAKKDLMMLVTEFTGDGKFQERINVQKGSRTIEVTATGKSLSDVFPIAGAIPFAGGAAFLIAATQGR